MRVKYDVTRPTEGLKDLIFWSDSNYCFGYLLGGGNMLKLVV